MRAKASRASASSTVPSRCPTPLTRTWSAGKRKIPSSRRSRTSPPTCTARRPAAHTPLPRHATKVSSNMPHAQSQPGSKWPCSAAAPSNHHEPTMSAKPARYETSAVLTTRLAPDCRKRSARLLAAGCSAQPTAARAGPTTPPRIRRVFSSSQAARPTAEAK